MTTINSIKELIEKARSLRETSHMRWLFRGQAQADWGLTPHVHRCYSSDHERYLTHEFRARAGLRHAHLPRYEDYAGWLALMQHYGLPTRLLDWSHSPLTALYFAVEKTMSHSTPRDIHPGDAALWALCPGELNQAKGLDRLIYPLNSRELDGLVQDAFRDVDFSCHAANEIAAAMAVEADIRMQVQRGAFTIHRTKVPLNEIQGADSWLRKFLIPADRVRELGVDIDALGLGLADLFPDLGSLAKALATSQH